MKKLNLIAILTTFALLISINVYADEEKPKTQKKSTTETTSSDTKPPHFESEPEMSRDPGIDYLTNYPDPFVSSTTVEFYLTQSSWVTIVIYHNNRRIVTYPGEFRKEGRHSFVFNAEQLPPGIYTCTIANGETVMSEKMYKKNPFTTKPPLTD